MSSIKVDLESQQVQKLKEVCREFGNDPKNLINILHKAQSFFGYLPAEVQEIIAQEMKIPVARIYGIVTFYSFFSMLPKGKYPVSVCLGTACYVRGAEKVLDEFKKVLNIKVGEVTPDNKFSLNCLRCVGACGLAPVVIIGEKTFGRVAPESIKEMLDTFE
jgi:NADP-reducing hydrogenase subunit HndA